MLDIDFTKFFSAWGKAPLRINPYYCLPLRSPKSRCRLCIENCPTKAIEIKEDSVKVIDNQCTGCAICANLCPTGVFEMANFDSHAFLEKAQAHIVRGGAVEKRSTTKIECYKVPFDYSTASSLRLPCLAHITPSLILRILSLGANEIVIRDAGICVVCESKCGDKIAKDAVSKTQEFLKQLGFEQKVFAVTEDVFINNLIFEGERLKDYKYELELTRRQVFSAFKKEAVKSVSNLIEENTIKIAKGKEGLKKSVPKEREKLLKMLAASISASAKAQCKIQINSHIFPTVTINTGCDICQLCSLFCPTDALVIEDTEKGIGITFKVASCTGCSICGDVCAKKVLSLETKETALLDIIEQKVTSVAWFDKSFCVDCGRSFVKTSVNGICDTCLKEKDIF